MHLLQKLYLVRKIHLLQKMHLVRKIHLLLAAQLSRKIRLLPVAQLPGKMHLSSIMLLLQERNLLITWILKWISRREARLVRDEIILSRIPDKDLMEYLKLEQKRLESQQHAREIREKRIWIAFQMTIALIAAVLVIYFLKDSPAILISILYTAGLLIAFNIWNKHKDGRSPKDQ